eukprot:scaffold107867_cov23-Tisochrysis_lutea.AAC.2
MEPLLCPPSLAKSLGVGSRPPGPGSKPADRAPTSVSSSRSGAYVAAPSAAHASWSAQAVPIVSGAVARSGNSVAQCKSAAAPAAAATTTALHQAAARRKASSIKRAPRARHSAQTTSYHAKLPRQMGASSAAAGWLSSHRMRSGCGSRLESKHSASRWPPSSQASESSAPERSARARIRRARRASWAPVLIAASSALAAAAGRGGDSSSLARRSSTRSAR